MADSSDMVDALRSRCCELLEYLPEDGSLRWRVGRRGSAKAGDVAGTVETNGYIRLRIDGRRYQAHRLVWLIAFGRMPDGEIDHINGNRSDNRLANLRDVTGRQNTQNRQRAYKSKARTDVVGPSFQTSRGMWLVNIRVDGRSKFIGRYLTIDEAESAYLDAKRQYHPGFAG